MEHNTLISHELEEMRSQINFLKEQLDKQAIINDTHIRRSMVAKATDMTRIIRRTIFGGIFAALYCPMILVVNDFSPAFIAVTVVMLAVCFVLTIYQYQYLKKVDFSQGNLVEIAAHIGRIRKHYSKQSKIVAPLLIIPWLGWFIYESYSMNSQIGLAFSIGAAVGGLIGGIIGLSINRKVIGKADEILSQLEELQKGE